MKIKIFFAEESQANVCELVEKNRQNQEDLLETSQQLKIFEAQIQTLKQEKSKLNIENLMVKSNLEKIENERFE